MSAEILTWDWKEQVDFDELNTTVNRLSGGLVHMRLAETGSDQFALVVANEPLDDSRADQLYEAWHEREYGA